jgi:type IV secretion system protein VirB10
LERQPGADAEGYAGLEDEVDNHWGTLFKAAILSTLLSIGSEVGSSGSEDDLSDPFDAAGRTASIRSANASSVGRSTSSPPSSSDRVSRPCAGYA